MNLNISMVSKIPIYEQIKDQIRDKVLSDELKAGTMLPSIRFFAKELKVGVITVKRAYDDLCDENILVSKAGIGVFVAEVNKEHAQKVYLNLLRDRLMDIKDYAEGVNISKEDIYKILNEIYGG